MAALATATRFVPMQAVHQSVHAHRNGPQDASATRQSQTDSATRTNRDDERSFNAMRMDSTLEAANGQGASLLEAALEAWADCKPDGYTLPESSVSLVLPAVACRVPGSWQSPGTSKMLNELFTPGGRINGTGPREPAVFQRMLKAHQGNVHFLHFWSAFSKAARLLASASDENILAICDEGLAMELETLRDGILRSFEVVEAERSPATQRAPLTMPSDELVQAIQKAASMSSAPDFWHAAGQALVANGSKARLSMEDITVIILSWLRDAIQWEYERQAPYPVLNIDSKLQDRSASGFKHATPQTFEDGIPVFVHIYDVSQEENIQKINRWLASRYNPLKFGGVFHAGIEVNGLEWSYGCSFSETMSGISCVEPKSHPCHTYRQSVQLRNTKLTAEEIADLLTAVIEEYPGDDYDLLRRNCCHFADDFARRLGAGRIPSWTHRLARLGARVDSAMQAITGRALIPMEESDEEEIQAD